MHAGQLLQKPQSHLISHVLLWLLHHGWHWPVVVAGAVESIREALVVVVTIVVGGVGGADKNGYRENMAGWFVSGKHSSQVTPFQRAHYNLVDLE